MLALFDIYYQETRTLCTATNLIKSFKRDSYPTSINPAFFRFPQCLAKLFIPSILIDSWEGSTPLLLHQKRGYKLCDFDEVFGIINPKDI